MILELLGMAGISWGIKKGGDAAQAAANRGVRKATRAVTNAGKAALAHIDERGTYHAHEGDPRGFCANPLMGHVDEIMHNDGTLFIVKCRKCGKTAKGVF